MQESTRNTEPSEPDVETSLLQTTLTAEGGSDERFQEVSSEDPSTGKENDSTETDFPIQQAPVPTSPHTNTFSASDPRKLLKRLASLTRPILQRFQDCLVDTWWPEAFSLIVSTSCLIAIVGLLLPYFLSHRPVPNSSGGLTLNTLLSILATASKSSLVFSVAGTISQAKWCWFRSSSSHNYRRPLQDLQTLDDASRGPLGSIQLLMKRTIFSICSIGAIVVILSLGYEPFLQQLVSYPVELIQISTDAWTREAPGISSDYYYNRIMGAIYGSNESYARTPICPSGNCTWPLLYSAGWCGSCGQAPQVSSETCDFTWQDYINDGQNISKKCTLSSTGPDIFAKLEISSGYNTSNLTLAYPAWWSLTFNESYLDFSQYFASSFQILGRTNPLMAFGYIDMSAGEPANGYPNVPISQWFKVKACILTPCLRQYNVSVQDGQVIEQVVDEDWGVLTQAPAEFDGYSNIYCWKPREFASADLTYEQIGDNNNSLVSLYVNRTHRSWCAFLWEEDMANFISVLSGNLTLGAYSSWNSTDEFWSTSDLTAGGTYAIPTDEGGLWDADISSYWPRIVQALSFGALYGDYWVDSNFLTAAGSVMAERTFVHVRWAWLILPALLNAIGIAFFAITIAYTRKLNLPLWKTSAIALLYHGLDGALVRPGESYETASAMEEAARGAYVRLSSRDEDGTGGRRQLRS